METEQCEHKDGWNTTETICIGDVDVWGTDIEVECECNHLGCGERRTFKFDITCLGEVGGSKDGK